MRSDAAGAFRFEDVAGSLTILSSYATGREWIGFEVPKGLGDVGAVVLEPRRAISVDDRPPAIRGRVLLRDGTPAACARLHLLFGSRHDDDELERPIWSDGDERYADPRGGFHESMTTNQGWVKVAATHPTGGMAVTRPMPVAALSGGAPIELRLGGMTAIVGIVVARGHPLAGACVFANPAHPCPNSFRVGSPNLPEAAALTDADGRYCILVPPGAWMLAVAEKDGESTPIRVLLVEEGERVRKVDLTLRPEECDEK